MKLDPDVLAVLSTLDYPKANQALITEALDRPLYLRVDKALRALGGTWSRGAKVHVFSGYARDDIEAAITSEEVTTDQDLGHFPTPAPLARELVTRAQVRAGQWALEPSAGAGDLAAALIAAGARVTAIERDPIRRQALRLRLPAATVLEHDDFLAYQPWKTGESGRRSFDRVVMNPPFRKIGSGDHLDHAYHAYRLLAPGGILVCVLPASVLFRRDRRYREFHGWASEVGELAELPDGSFRDSGTNVRTVLFTATGSA